MSAGLHVQPSRTVVSQFLTALFTDAAGVIEFRAFPSRARTFARLADLDTLLDFVAERVPDQDCYFGVAARKDATSGALGNCTTLGAVFADIDYKMVAEPEARRHLTEFPLSPSVIVQSGHGLHVYYLLREPLDLQVPADESRARALLVRLAVALGGDRSAAEPARILRVPETWNRKAEPVPVVLELCEPTRRYNASELEASLPAAPETTRGNGFHAEPAVGVGDRHVYLYRLARSLKHKGLSPTAVLAAARVENAERCRPPLPDDEVERQVASAFTQADRPGFEPQTVGERDTAGAQSTDGPQEPPRTTASPEAAPAWPRLAPEALYGTAGRIVDTIAPRSEADPVAILLHVLVAIGNLVGPGPHARVEQDPHPARLNVVLVGKSSKGRKGTGWSTPARCCAPWTRAGASRRGCRAGRG